MVTVADDLEKKVALEEAAKRAAEESESEDEEDERIAKLRAMRLARTH